MNIRYRSTGFFLTLMLLANGSVLAESDTPQSSYTYKDDWAVISAPPPPGPYRAVNIDPRVPGADAVPPLSMEAPAPTSSRIPAEALANPPAAGTPAIPTATDRPTTTLRETAPPPAPPVSSGDQAARTPPPQQGQYYRGQQQMPTQGYPAAPGTYPGYQGHPGYQGRSPYGYYGQPGYSQGEQQVPPPPAYDAYMRNQPPYYGAPNR